MTLSDLRTLWRGHPKAMAGFVLAALVTLFFVARITVSAIYWHNHQREPVQAWMTIGYVAHSWGLRAPDIDAAAGLPHPEKGHPFTISEIARQRGVSEAEIIRLVTDTVAKMTAEAPKP